MSNRVNLHIDSRQGRRRLDCDTSRRGPLLKVFAVDLVHSTEFTEHSCLHNILQRSAASLKQQLKILERLPSLARHVSGQKRVRCQID